VDLVHKPTDKLDIYHGDVAVYPAFATVLVELGEGAAEERFVVGVEVVVGGCGGYYAVVVGVCELFYEEGHAFWRGFLEGLPFGYFDGGGGSAGSIHCDVRKGSNIIQWNVV